jgi:hypothetical protein
MTRPGRGLLFPLRPRLLGGEPIRNDFDHITSEMLSKSLVASNTTVERSDPEASTATCDLATTASSRRRLAGRRGAGP